MIRILHGIAAAAGVAAMSLLVAASVPDASAAGGEKPAGAPPARSLASSDRKSLERTLKKAFEALPSPAKEFRLDAENGTSEVGFAATAWAVATKAPAEARGDRVYEGRVGSGEASEPVVLEVRIYVNMERALPEPLGSEGGVLETFTHDGLPGSRASLAGVDPGRVALPLTAEETSNALTVLRLHVGAASIESYLAEVAQGRKPPRTPWDKTAAKSPSEVRTLVVEYYGPRAEVERLLKATTAAPLRALLTP
ncbi:MAG TPA: hypothetical protein VFS09_10435 [Candidatus Eisenbacteria bacterium]|nr:hypothetical protein [Candidatus Eisenbacteria bacterium]